MTFAVIRVKWDDLARDPLARAFAFSLALHLLLFGILELGSRLCWWQSIRSPAWLEKASSRQESEQLRQRQVQRERKVPLVFVEVDPSQATAEAPKETQFYSALNSRASNPDIDFESDRPKIDGKQTQVVKTFDTLRAQPAQPAKPPPTRTRQKQDEPPKAKAIPAPSPADLLIAKPSLGPVPDRGTAQAQSKPSPPPEHARPRTLAAARQQRGMIAGEKMKQEGGVKERRIESSLNVRATPFGAYDAAFIAAVQKRWYDLLDEHYAGERSGKVILQFSLNYDGRVSNLEIADSDVGDFLAMLCQKAIADPAPYAPWPTEMRRSMGNHRDVRFTFFYN